MPVLRCTALVDAPAGTVAAVLVQPAGLRATLAGLGIEVPGGYLLVGPDVPVRWRRARGRPVRAWLRVCRADETLTCAVLRGGRYRDLAVSASLAATPAGTLLTAAVWWQRWPGRLGAAVDVLGGRTAVLRGLDAMVRAVRERAERLAGAAVVVGAVLRADDRVLAAQRDRPAHLAGRWEFPGGQVEAGEDERSALVRECAEELGAAVRVADRIGPDVVLPGDRLLRLYTAELAPGARPVPREHRALRWVSAAELASLDWLDADRVVLPQVATALREAG